MNWIDVVIIALVLISSLLGFKLGLMRTAFLFVAFVLGIVISAQVAASPPSFWKNLVPNPSVRYLVSYIILFVLIFVGVNIAGSLIYKAVAVTPLKGIDRGIGIFLGFLAGVTFVGLLVTYLVKYPLADSEEWLEGSFLVPILRAIISHILQGLEERESVVSILTRYI